MEYTEEQNKPAIDNIFFILKLKRRYFASKQELQFKKKTSNENYWISN